MITIEEKVSKLLKLAADPETSESQRQLALSYVQTVFDKAFKALRFVDDPNVDHFMPFVEACLEKVEE